MAFSNFKSIDELIVRYAVRFERAEFIRPVPAARFSAHLLDELAFTLTDVPFDRSEVAAREAIIYPVLRDVWRHYREHLTLLSGEPLEADSDLRGELDYVVCRRSPLGPLLPDQPFLLVGEAKRDDPSLGWGQALGGMIAARMTDGVAGRTYFGLVTTGPSWTFGTLTADMFTIDPRPYGVQNLDALAGALHFVFAACRDQLTAPAGAAP